MSFDADGFEEFAEKCRETADDIETIRKTLPERLDAAVEDSAEDLSAEMKAQIHVMDAIQTGHLLRSIDNEQLESAQKGGRATQSVYTNVEYAPYVNYGTDPHYITPEDTSVEEVRERRERARQSLDQGAGLPDDVLEAPALQFNVGGNAVHKDMVYHPGSRAKPFFDRAVNRHEAQERLAKSIDKYTSDLFTGVMK